MEKIDITKGEIINLGSSEVHKVEHVISMLCSQIDKTISPIIQEKQGLFKEISEQYVDFSKLKGLISNYRPTDIDSGLKLTIDWYKEYKDQLVRPS